MKVEQKGPAQVVAGAAAGQPFKKLLADAKREQPGTKPAQPPPLTTGAPVVAKAVSAQVKTVRQAAEVVQQARGRIETEAQRLSQARSNHVAQAQQATAARAEYSESVIQRLDERALDLICKELQGAFDEKPAAPTRTTNLEPFTAGKNAQAREVSGAMTESAQPGVAEATAADSKTNESKAEQAVALIEKIEVFVKTQRPALALTLNNSLGARVEIERVGPRQVALRLVGHNGPPSPEAVGRIRDEMRARGLKVAALSVA